MRKPYTPTELRALAKQNGPQWSGEARAALSFAADVIDTANAVIAQPVSAKPLPPRTPCELTTAEFKIFLLGWRESEAAHGITKEQP